MEKNKIEFIKLTIENAENVVSILKKDELRYPSGDYPDIEWITAFIENGYAYGILKNDILISAIVAESVLLDGVLLWLIATDTSEMGKGYGQELVTKFEIEMKSIGKQWMFLTSGIETNLFYLRNGFVTNGRKVCEYSKSL